MLGFDRVVIQAHRHAKAKALANAGKVAAKAVGENLCQAIREGLSR